MRKFTVAICFLFLFSAASTAQIKIDPKNDSGIWFKNSDTFGNRFLYSQAIIWPGSIAGHIAVYIAKDDFDWSKAVSLTKYKSTFTELPKIDEDHWSWNYELHPYMGSLSYLCYRNRKASPWESAAGSALNSVIYEYIIAGGTQQPSLNDMLVTPIAGSLLGEGLYQLKKYVIRDKYLSTFDKILLTIIDPVEVFYFGFNYQKFLRYSYR